MKKLIILAVVLIAVLAGCTAKPVVETPVDPSVVSFEALSQSIEWKSEGDKFTLVAPDQSVSLAINQSFASENDVVMNVSFVNVGSYNVRVFSFQKFIGKLYADLMSFLIRYFSGHECLNQMEGFVWVCLIGF